MAYPQGYLYQPSASLALYSCPAYSTSVISGPRTEELGRSSSGSAFAPYAGSTAFTSASPGYNSHLPYNADAAAAATFTSYVSSPYDHTTGMAGSIGYHPYAAPLGTYPYGDPAYRKNATRDATATLKAWLNEHRKNPYPTKGEKIMLAIITKMTLTQVSTWFANARRRLKKENKMTWTPRNRSEDEEEEDLDPERPEEYEQGLKTDYEGERSERAAPCPASEGPPCSLLYSSDPASTDCTPHCSPEPQQRPPLAPRPSSPNGTVPPPPPPPPPPLHPPPMAAPSPGPTPTPPPKPKLWSLAEIATSSDKKLTSDSPCPRTPFPHGTPLTRPLYYSPPFIYNNYSTLGPGLSLNGLHQFSRADRDFRLRAFGHERDDLKKGTTSA